MFVKLRQWNRRMDDRCDRFAARLFTPQSWDPHQHLKGYIIAVGTLLAGLVVTSFGLLYGIVTMAHGPLDLPGSPAMDFGAVVAMGVTIVAFGVLRIMWLDLAAGHWRRQQQQTDAAAAAAPAAPDALPGYC